MTNHDPQTGTILDRIMATKREEIVALKARLGDGIGDLAARCADLSPTRGFARALESKAPPLLVTGGATTPQRPALIAEVKKASPSKGVIRADFDPVALAQAYHRGGAACLSVLTDQTYFQGELAFLQAIRDAVPLPLLRKDFILDAVQIYEARLGGADAVLLIVSCVPSAERLRELRLVAESLQMDALVEVHDADELAVAVSSGARLVGVNNRNLHTFEVSLTTAETLIGQFPPGAVAVAESGIFTPADVAQCRRAGAHAILVGEALMRQPDVEAATRALLA